jgi:beta-galactosidase
MHWANLFMHQECVYILGVNKPFQDVHICRSDNNGLTWSKPGKILANGQYHTAPVPITIHDGRIWRAFENAIGNTTERNFQTFVISAPIDSDLLKASSWTATNKILYNKNWTGEEWLEGNLVITPDHRLVNIMRNRSERGDRIALVDVIDKQTISFNPKTGFVRFPGGGVKFTIRFDSISNKYWSLTNYIPQRFLDKRPNDSSGIRNTLALISSKDLNHWTVERIFLQHPDIRNVGFQYADWQFDGDDIIMVVRTAYSQPDGTNANNFHDANYISFHRVTEFREKEVYLFSYFKGNGEDGLHLAYSLDGMKWSELNEGKSFLSPKIGNDKLMRDPSICQSPNGKFHMVWTTGWHDKIIGYASSDDLILWSEQKEIPVMTHNSSTKNTWAPELFYNKSDSLFYILWSSTLPEGHSPIKDSDKEKGYNHRIYYSVTADFKHFSETKLLFNPDFSVIDASVIQLDGEYLLFFKNENPNPAEKNIRMTAWASMTSSFPSNVSPPITGNYWAEGPSPLLVGDYLYVYFDKYIEKKYGAVRSLDLKNWQDVSEDVVFPTGTRHGTAFKVKQSILRNIIENCNMNCK